MSSGPDRPPPRHRAPLRGRSRFTVVAGARVVAALVSVALFAGFGYGWYSYRTLRSGTQRIAIAGLGRSETPPPPTDSLGHTIAAPPSVPGTAQNILVVGIDSRAGLTDAQRRAYHVGVGDQSTSADTIMLVHVPADGKSAVLVSIPRDTYVQIPGFDDNKINAAYADGYYLSGAHGAKAQQGAGASLLLKTVKALTGVPIDHYVQVGFAGFVNIVKAIGDIPVNLCESVDDTVAHNRSLGISGGSGFEMSAGHHSLTPIQALEFVRQRHNIPGPVDNDFGRELRQRYFLKAVLKKILSADVLLNPIALHELITAANNAFTFDQTGFDLTQFAAQMSELAVADIKGSSIPTTGTHTYPNPVGDAVTVDPAAVAVRVQQLFGLLPVASPSSSPSTRTTHPSGSMTPSPTATSSVRDRGCVY